MIRDTVIDVWPELKTEKLATPMIKKADNIHDYEWDSAWRGIQKERGPHWDRKSLVFLKVYKVKEVILTLRYACTLFNDHTILVYDRTRFPEKKDEVEPEKGFWREEDLVKSQLQ